MIARVIRAIWHDGDDDRLERLAREIAHTRAEVASFRTAWEGKAAEDAWRRRTSETVGWAALTAIGSALLILVNRAVLTAFDPALVGRSSELAIAVLGGAAATLGVLQAMETLSPHVVRALYYTVPGAVSVLALVAAGALIVSLSVGWLMTLGVLITIYWYANAVERFEQKRPPHGGFGWWVERYVWTALSIAASFALVGWFTVLAIRQPSPAVTRLVLIYLGVCVLACLVGAFSWLVGRRDAPAKASAGRNPRA